MEFKGCFASPACAMGRRNPAMKFTTTFTAVQRGALFLAAVFLVPSLAHAHVGVGETSGFAHGFGHPLSGLDHICAMVAVGLWAAQMGGRAIWAVPLTFVTVMAFGGLLGMMHVDVPFIETGIVVSVLTLGVFIAAAVRLPLIASIIVVGLFAICHGHAHGAEMPGNGFRHRIRHRLSACDRPSSRNRHWSWDWNSEGFQTDYCSLRGCCHHALRRLSLVELKGLSFR